LAGLKSQYDHLYISPHFDDVALSCGGQVFRHAAIGDSVLVVTVMAAELPAGPQSETVLSLHRRWTDSLGGATVEAIVAQRRAEDREAFAGLRADVLHLPFLDCIYRPGPDGDSLYPGPTDMFGAFNLADVGIIDAVAGALAALPPADHVYVPLGVGRHIDHGVTRRAAERVFDHPAYYEDYPYTMVAGALEAVLPPEARGGWSAETMWLTETALAAKIAAVAAYRSQLSSFFAGPEDLAARLRDEGRRVRAEAEAEGERAPDWAAGGERLWRPVSR
jgi:LmbE family N-acetylglucosaminyl deacetylase